MWLLDSCLNIRYVLYEMESPLSASLPLLLFADIYLSSSLPHIHSLIPSPTSSSNS